jgi:hypothetical protein
MHAIGSGSSSDARRRAGIGAGLLFVCCALVACSGQPSATGAVGAPSAASTAQSATNTQAGVPACPARDFEGFLQAYASDPRVRERFTAPVLQVARISESEAGDTTVLESVPADEYEGFLLSYRNGKFGFVGGERDADANAPGLALILKPEPAGAYFVTFPDNVEAISYRFERHGDCWRLTEDPEATP